MLLDVKVLDERLQEISGKVTERLDEGFKKTNETFTRVMERLATIDKAQEKIDGEEGVAHAAALLRDADLYEPQHHGPRRSRRGHPLASLLREARFRVRAGGSHR